MSAPVIVAIVVGASLAYMFAAGVAWGFAERWLKDDHTWGDEVSYAILAAAWPLYLVAFVGYRVMFAVRWVPTLGIRAVRNLSARKLPRATVVDTRTRKEGK